MEKLPSIELAMKNERAEMEFYRQQAQRTRNELARAMFEQLAADEQQHLERITELHQRLVNEGSWPAELPITVAGTDVPRLLEQLPARAGKKVNADADDEHALERAIDFEGKGVAFYRELAEACDNQAEKNFFSFLSGIEDEHRRSLLESLAYLRDPEAWLMQHERAGLDGA